MGNGVPVEEAYHEVGASTVTTVEIPETEGLFYRPKVAYKVIDDAVYSKPNQFIHSWSLPETSVVHEIFIRSLDIVGSVCILILASPIIFLIIPFIKFTSPGSVFYKQDRIGKAGKLFTLYKFRSMVNDAEKHRGPVWAKKDDERVTCIGRFLRKTRIDELPQLFNVIKGDMSLVGPRPERPYFVHQHKALQGIRLMVKPGLTGIAQIRSLYNLKPDHKLKYDYLYIQKRSFLLNLYILIKTIPVLLSKTGW